MHAGDATMQVVTDIGVARVYDAIVVAVEEVYMLLEHRAVVRAACINITVIHPITQQQCSTLRFHALTQARSMVFHATRGYTCMSFMTLSPADCKCTRTYSGCPQACRQWQRSWRAAARHPLTCFQAARLRSAGKCQLDTWMQLDAGSAQPSRCKVSTHACEDVVHTARRHQVAVGAVW